MLNILHADQICTVLTKKRAYAAYPRLGVVPVSLSFLTGQARQIKLQLASLV